MATDIEKVRILIPDNEEVYDGEYLFSDDDITAYLEVAGDSVLRAAGYALLAVSTSEAIISKVIRTQDLQTDGAKVAEAMRKNAEKLFERADKEDELANGYFFEIVNYSDGWSSDNPELTEWNWGHIR